MARFIIVSGDDVPGNYADSPLAEIATHISGVDIRSNMLADPSCRVFLELELPAASITRLEGYFSAHFQDIPVYASQSDDGAQPGHFRICLPEPLREVLGLCLEGLAEMTRRAEEASPEDQGSEAVLLTHREREVLTLIAEGMTNKQIAGSLFISPATVDTHRNHIMEKLNAPNTAAMVRIAVSSRLID